LPEKVNNVAKGKLAALIIAAAKPKYEDLKKENENAISGDEGLTEETAPGLLAASDEIISAIESKDSRALAEALKAFYEICEEEEHKEMGYSDEEESEDV
jgi:hypothetical protein